VTAVSFHRSTVPPFHRSTAFFFHRFRRSSKKSLREKIWVRILRHDHKWHFSCPDVGERTTRHFSQLAILAAPTPRTIN
jgi:hypothetical protein